MENIDEQNNITEIINKTIQNITEEILTPEINLDVNESNYYTTLIFGVLITLAIYFIYNFFGK